MNIIATMKDKTIKHWQWHTPFAWVSLRYITELQEDIENNKVSYVSLLNDDGTVYMKKGLKLVYWFQYKQHAGEEVNSYNRI
jgi:hypothetical protein